MKKPMTIDELATLMIETMASKEDVQEVRDDVQGVKQDVQQVKQDVQQLSQRVDDLHVDIQKIDNKMNRVENYKVTQLELIKLLRDKRVITVEEAHKLLTA